MGEGISLLSMGSQTDNQVAIGLKAKTGRAIAVALRGPVAAPQVLRRLELDLTDRLVPATRQPYHEVMDLTWNESQQKVKPLVRTIEKVAVKGLSQLVEELRSAGLKVVGVGIVGTADRDLAKIGNYHIRAHAAEGLLFRQVLESAARANKLPYRSFIEKSLPLKAAGELHYTAVQLIEGLASLGRAVGPPWRTDQRLAAMAAWLNLDH